MKTEADSCQTYENWPLAFIEKNRLASAGFYYTNVSCRVCSALYWVEIDSSEKGDVPFKDYQR